MPAMSPQEQIEQVCNVPRGLQREVLEFLRSWRMTAATAGVSEFTKNAIVMLCNDLGQYVRPHMDAPSELLDVLCGPEREQVAS